MNRIEIYTKNYCPYCARAKRLLDSLDLNYTEYELTFDRQREFEMIERSGRVTVPQVFIDGVSIGGSDELVDMAESGALLDRLSSRVNINDSNRVENHV